MSHNVEYFSYPEKVDKKRVQQELDNFVAMEDWQEGCQGLYHDIRWIGDKIYANSEEARKAIEKLDRGNYDQLAVKYCRIYPAADEKASELKIKVQQAESEYRKRDQEVYARTVTSALIGCKKCGSKLARSYLKTNFCPVCRTDMRPGYWLTMIQAAKNKMLRAGKELDEYSEKHGRREVVWLVKIEYHT